MIPLKGISLIKARDVRLYPGDHCVFSSFLTIKGILPSMSPDLFHAALGITFTFVWLLVGQIIVADG